MTQTNSNCRNHIKPYSFLWSLPNRVVTATRGPLLAFKLMMMEIIDEKNFSLFKFLFCKIAMYCQTFPFNMIIFYHKILAACIKYGMASTRIT